MKTKLRDESAVGTAGVEEVNVGVGVWSHSATDWHNLTERSQADLRDD